MQPEMIGMIMCLEDWKGEMKFGFADDLAGADSQERVSWLLTYGEQGKTHPVGWADLRMLMKLCFLRLLHFLNSRLGGLLRSAAGHDSTLP